MRNAIVLLLLFSNATEVTGLFLSVTPVSNVGTVDLCGQALISYSC